MSFPLQVLRLAFENVAGSDNHLFNYEEGMYVKIRAPDLSLTEWHPFTISSAPKSPVRTVRYMWPVSSKGWLRRRCWCRRAVTLCLSEFIGTHACTLNRAATVVCVAVLVIGRGTGADGAYQSDAPQRVSR